MKNWPEQITLYNKNYAILLASLMPSCKLNTVFTCFTAFTRDVRLMVNCVTVPALMEWFRRSRQYIDLSGKCFDKRHNLHLPPRDCVQHFAKTRKNKYKVYFFFLSLQNLHDFDLFV